MTAVAVRAVTPSERERAELIAELRQAREEARERTREVDLLVAALQDHIRDLKSERDYLRAELRQATAERRLAGATWLGRGLKGSHG